MMTDREKALARLIQADLPLDRRPFETIGRAVGLSEAEVLALIHQWKEEGLIRKMGVIIRHQQVGYTGNAMVIWAVPTKICESTGNLFASFPEVTHCYERTPPFEGKYNLFTMIHDKGHRLEEIVERLASLSGIGDFKILTSEEELKKTSMTYF